MTTRSKALRLKEGKARVEELNRDKGTAAMVRSPSVSSGLDVGFTNRVEDKVLEGGKLREARNSPNPLNSKARTTIDPLIGEGSSPSALPEVTNHAGDSRDTTRVYPRAIVAQDKNFEEDMGEENHEVSDEDNVNFELRAAECEKAVVNEKIKILSDKKAYIAAKRVGSGQKAHIAEIGDTHPNLCSDISKGGGRSG
ncbi:hypothetical protein U1Q18_015434 [Sarracenia purpurea var. burkii]